MKLKLLLLTILIFAFSGGMKAKVQRTVTPLSDGLQIEYSFGDLQLVQSPSSPGEFIPKIEGLNTEVGEGKPALPRLIESFEVPFGMKIGSISIEESPDTIKAICAPSEPVRMENDPSTEIYPITPYDGIWPIVSAESIGIGIYRDIQIGRIKISPVRYSCQNQEIVYSKNLKVSIHFENSGIMRIAESNPIIFHNTEDSDLMQRISLPVNNASKSPALRSVGPMPIEAPWLLIITPSLFEQEVERFAAWKRRMGFNVKIESADSNSLQDPNYTYTLLSNTILIRTIRI